MKLITVFKLAPLFLVYVNKDQFSKCFVGTMEYKYKILVILKRIINQVNGRMLYIDFTVQLVILRSILSISIP